MCPELLSLLCSRYIEAQLPLAIEIYVLDVSMILNNWRVLGGGGGDRTLSC